MKSEYFNLPQKGTRVRFRGVTWNDGWEFDAPCVIYKPILRIFHVGGSAKEEIERCIETICIDLCVLDKCLKMSSFEQREFKWRGWSIKNLSRRKNAVHAQYDAIFWQSNHGDPTFEIQEIK